jgi:hypothetical protein
MSCVDRLTVNKYRNILKEFYKNPSGVNVPDMMAEIMESPDNCCTFSMVICCFCIIGPALRDAKKNRSRTLEDFFLASFPGMDMNKIIHMLMKNLEAALAVLERNKISLDHVRYQYKRLRTMYPHLTSDDALVIDNALVILKLEF